jgi:hypothetical protein
MHAFFDLFECTVVEPPSSFLDPGLLFLWILFASVLALVGLPYLKTYFPATPTSKGSKKGKKASSSSHGASSASTLSSSPSEKVIVPAQAGKPYPASTQPYEEVRPQPLFLALFTASSLRSRF